MLKPSPTTIFCPRAGRQFYKVCGRFRLLFQHQGRHEQSRHGCQVGQALVLFEAANMSFSIADGDGQFTLCELRPPAKIF
jgi:hypothetical protein